MSDFSEDELVATKLENGSMNIYNLLDYWYMKYGIKKYEIEFAKEFIMKLEGKNEQ